jgi:predicted DNA-binding helix-hairpin-helix protein
MDLDRKIRFLMEQALTDREGNGSLRPSEPPSRGPRVPPSTPALGWRAREPLDPINIRALSDRGFGRMRIFRILLSNACAFNCDYCPMRADRRLPRHALPPSTLAEAFLTAYRKGWVSGLFVTSGIPRNARFAMDRMIELAEILRFRHRYAGYLHAKAVSGAEPEQVERLALLCDRISYNLEAACQATLDRTAPEKRLPDGLALLEQVRELSRASGPRRLPGDPRPPGRAVKAGATTQFVVGLGSESDRQFLETSHRLWKSGTIHHPHFAAFRPIEETPLETEPETPVRRENRLYQADYLTRRYGFEPQELVYGGAGNLPLGRDPKLAWALAHPERFPVEITTAVRESLIRVPGLGPSSVDRVLLLRRQASSVGLSDLARIGAGARRAAGFLTWRGKLLGTKAVQEPLFAEEELLPPGRVYSFSPGTFR